VIITAVLDESGTHGSETMLITAWLAKAGQWREFQKRSRALFDEYGFKVFHAKEWRDSDGEFKGWKVNKKIRFLDEFGHIANEELEAGFNAVLKISDYKKFYANSERPKKLQFDTAYGVCFRAILMHAADFAALHRSKDWPARKERHLSIILEQGAKNAGDAMRIFDEFKAELRPEHKSLIDTFATKTKEECLPLAASDIIAHGTFRAEEGIPPTWKFGSDMKMSKSYSKNFYRLGIEEAALRSLKEDLMRMDSDRLRFGASRSRNVSPREDNRGRTTGFRK